MKSSEHAHSPTVDIASFFWGGGHYRADVPQRAAGAAAPPPQPAHPNVTVIRRVSGKSGGGVALQDAKGSLLAVSPHPRTISVSVGTSASPSPRPESRGPGTPVAHLPAHDGAAPELGHSAFKNLAAASPVAPDQRIGLHHPRQFGMELDRDGAAVAADGGAFQGFAMASGTPIKVAPLKGAPPFGLPASAATLSGAPLRDAGSRRAWPGGASVFSGLAPPSSDVRRDPRTEPTVGCDGGGGGGGDNSGSGTGPGGQFENGSGECVTMPGGEREGGREGGRARRRVLHACSAEGRCTVK